jgi:hypothetical protein
MPAPAEIVQLVELFEHNYDQYHAPAFTEAAVRHQFLDPFFLALGWDVNNAQGFAEQYKEVVHEDKVRIGGATKAPDYSFRIGKERKFFVEAKKPAVDIQHDIEPAYQLRRYAWSAKLPLSILTDFEELSVYDCRSKPAATDKASAGRILLLNYREYPTRWDEIAGVFAKPAVWQGALDKFAEAKAGKRGTAEVDDEFLAEIERWRELLAHNLVLRNPTLRGRDVNWAVQQTIDRIVFLRICEARDLETFEQLRALLNGGHTYARLQELFRRADLRYNSGLFHFEVEKDRAEAPDTLTPNLDIDDKVLKDIIEHLYYPQSPYEFSVLPADILGHVYERFLGKVIRLTPGRQVKIEEKPEVRKAGGVYYTPTYIVDYIVRQTVGPLLEGKTPGQVGATGWSPLRILDAACGSGSFLLGAYQFLLDWHLAEYLKDPDRWLKGKRPPMERANGGVLRLSIEERKRILMNNIYGVDIDPQAVEVTKLSLLLKVLEGEGVAAQMSFLPERVLPDLGRNIRCGNSLIGPEFYEGKLDLPDEETVGRVNAFDWKQEFPEAMSAGGFDAIIGNPPYIRIHNLVDHYPDEVKFIQERFSTAQFGKVDIYVAFVEKGIGLLKGTGLLGFILPNKFMQADYGVGMRRLLSARRAMNKLVDFGNAQVFEAATTYTCLLFLTGGSSDMFEAAFNRRNEAPDAFLPAAAFETRSAAGFGPTPWLAASSIESQLLSKIETLSQRLSDVAELMITGVKTGANSVFVFQVLESNGNTFLLRPEDTTDHVELEAMLLRPYLKAESLKRYKIGRGSRLLLYPYSSVGGRTRLLPEAELRHCPKTWQYLLRNRKLLEARQKGAMEGPNWYGLTFASSLEMFSTTKLVTPTLSPHNAFAFDSEGYFFPQGAGGGCGIVPCSTIRSEYLLGLLNSRLLTFHFQRISSAFQGGWFAYEPRYLNRIPIRTIDFTDPADAARHDRMVALVTQMLDLHARLAAEGVPHEKPALQRRIEMTDRQIDGLVYELYGLTEAEIGMVAGA